MIANISKEVTQTAINAITPLFHELRNAPGTTPLPGSPLAHLEPSDFDWALHPGGAAILRGAQERLDLTDNHIRASLDIYKTFGNSSSSCVLTVLDRMRHMGVGRENVVAASFGPGFMVEMCLMRRCGDGDGSASTKTSVGSRRYRVWAALQSRLKRFSRRSRVVTEVRNATAGYGVVVR